MTKTVHIQIDAPLTEMGDAVELSSMVPVDATLLASVTDGDANPVFVISDIEEQESQKKIEYDANALELIANQVNAKQPTGYLGHIKDSDRDTAFPMPQVLWVAAKVIRGTKARLITKGYLLPEGSARGLIKRRVLNTVSWAGDAVLEPKSSGGYKIRDFHLESIDFSRKNREGMKGQRLALVTEMMGEDVKGGKKKVKDDDDVTYERIVSQLTISELKTHNAALYRSITEMVKDEAETEKAQAVKAKEEELEQKHKVELEAVPEISIVDHIKKLLGVDKIENVEDAVVELMHKLDDLGKKVVQEWFNNEILAKKISSEKARTLVSRLIPVTEMQGDWRTDSGIEKIKQGLEDRVADALENDEAIKSVVKEMGSDRGGLRLSNSRAEDRWENKNNRNSNGDSGGKPELKDTGNVAVQEYSF